MLASGPGGREPRATRTGPLHAASFELHVERFNRMVDEGVVNHVPNARAWEWLAANIPSFECPDRSLEETYYYRWWAFRKHLKKTPDGFIFTEFIRPVRHATRHNAISCALGHHVNEGRWLHDPRYIDQYVRFWLRSGPGGGPEPRFHQFSGWLSDAVYGRWLVNRDTGFVVGLLDALIADYEAWEKERRLPGGLFWQYDVADGMEESISGSRHHRNARPTINSYMYGNARALSRIARLASRGDVARTYDAEARRLKGLVQDRLWDEKARYFKTLLEKGALADVREQIGFIPWYFGLPDPGYESAWTQLTDPRGFRAPYGPTTAEQRHPGFRIAWEGDDCQWNGPSWPFSTTMTLKALANLLNDYDQRVMSKRDYFETFRIYARSHRRELEDGRTIPWIDENLDPYSGEWHARRLKIRKGRFDGRGDHYNHSGFADLVITGLVGLRPRADEIVEVNPLVPEGTWDWFCLDRVPYAGHVLTVVWDRTGGKYGRGAGLRVLADGREIARAARLGRVRGRLPR
ncbi:MAG TPA: glycosyl hydrolase family 65 protein [Vicinamibacteria bacterium]|nr:glycosyl hydrolase family 65 protein [Vicinamibacteria bacterium]